MKKQVISLFLAFGISLVAGAQPQEKLTGDNKELLIIPGANHTDLYDRMDKIPFDKLNAFFKAYLK